MKYIKYLHATINGERKGEKYLNDHIDTIMNKLQYGF